MTFSVKTLATSLSHTYLKGPQCKLIPAWIHFEWFVARIRRMSFICSCVLQDVNIADWWSPGSFYWKDKKQYWKKIKDFHKFILESQRRSKAQRIVYIALAINLTSRNEMYTVFMIKCLLLGAVLLGTYWCNPNFSCPSVLWTEWQVLFLLITVSEAEISNVVCIAAWLGC